MRVLPVLLALLALAACEPAHDGEMEAGVRIEDVWARPADTTGAARSAAYFTLRNRTSEPVRIVGVRADVARVAELHLSFEEGGVMRMRPVTDGVEVAPGEAVAFEPGSYHIMLIDLQRPLVVGDRFPITLTLAPGGEREVEVDVRAP